MASIRKRGNSYLLVVSMGYDLAGRRRKARQKTQRGGNRMSNNAEKALIRIPPTLVCQAFSPARRARKPL